MISSLRGGVLVIPPVVVSSLVVVPPIVLLGGKFECLEESLAFLGELSCHLPFEMGFAGLFFPLFEGPGDLCGRVEVGGINDGCYVLGAPIFIFSLITNTFPPCDLFPHLSHHMILSPDHLPNILTM